MDLQKSFYSVDHRLVLGKIRSFGLLENVVRCIGLHPMVRSFEVLMMHGESTAEQMCTIICRSRFLDSRFS